MRSSKYRSAYSPPRESASPRYNSTSCVVRPYFSKKIDLASSIYQIPVFSDGTHDDQRVIFAVQVLLRDPRDVVYGNRSDVFGIFVDIVEAQTIDLRVYQKASNLWARLKRKN